MPDTAEFVLLVFAKEGNPEFRQQLGEYHAMQHADRRPGQIAVPDANRQAPEIARVRAHSQYACHSWPRRRNIPAMSIDTVVAIPDDLKAVLDHRAPSPPERDELIAAALRAYFAWPLPGEDASDLALINAHAKELNAEAEDALSYQVPL